jgi:hypothetical protein
LWEFGVGSFSPPAWGFPDWFAALLAGMDRVREGVWLLNLLRYGPGHRLELRLPSRVCFLHVRQAGGLGPPHHHPRKARGGGGALVLLHRILDELLGRERPRPPLPSKEGIPRGHVRS